MNAIYLAYLSIFISLIGIGISVYTIFIALPKKENSPSKEKKKKVEVVVVEEKSTPIPQVPVVAVSVKRKREVEVKITKESVVVEQPTEPKEPSQKLFVSTPKFVKNIGDGPTNDWYLEVTGHDGSGFDILVDWSDGSHDVMGGIIPVELEFSKSHGIVPTRIHNIPPRKNSGAQFLWELNGFHWS